MTYIPDTRSDDYYNEKYLKEKDKEFIKGYDYAVNSSFEFFLENLDAFDFEVDGEDINIGKILENHPDILAKFREVAKQNFESDRDEMIVSMIDYYSDDEYAEIRTDVDGVPYEEEL